MGGVKECYNHDNFIHKGHASKMILIHVKPALRNSGLSRSRVKEYVKSTTLDLLSVSLYTDEQPYMSLVMRKPAFCICENKDADQLRGNREADQRLCFRYTDSTIPLLPKYEISSL